MIGDWVNIDGAGGALYVAANTAGPTDGTYTINFSASVSSITAIVGWLMTTNPAAAGAAYVAPTKIYISGTSVKVDAINGVAGAATDETVRLTAAVQGVPL